MSDKINGFIAKHCLTRQMFEPVYKDFINKSLKDFIDNNKEYVEYTYKQNGYDFFITIKKDNKNAFYIYDREDKILM